jgi:hypothetical protein
MKRIRVDSAGQWFGRFAVTRVNAAQAIFIEKHAGSVGGMSQSVAVFGDSLDDWPVHTDSVCGRPFLLFDAAFFFRSDFDQVFTAASSAVMTAPVLDDGKFEWNWWHD